MPKLIKRSLPFDLRFPKRIFSSRKRFFLLVGAFFLLLLTAAFLYMLGMYFFQGESRGFWEASQWAAGTISTTGYGGESSWQHPAMVVYVVLVQFAGVFFIFLIFPIYLIPFLEERFETRLPNAKLDAKDHVVIFHHGPPVATLLDELGQVNRRGGDRGGRKRERADFSIRATELCSAISTKVCWSGPVCSTRGRSSSTVPMTATPRLFLRRVNSATKVKF